MDNIYHQYWQQELMYQLASADRYRKRAYVCSPFRADTHEQCEKNLRTARAYMFYANKKMNMNAAAPHAYMPLLLCDEIPAERAIALRFGLEILEQLPEVEQVVVPIGGGGLISGVAFAIKQLKPSCKVIGVQAGVVASMYASRQAGKVTTVPDAATLADGIHVLTPGSLTFEMCQKYVDEIVTVSEDEIAAAILALLEVQKTVAEGAGATPVAACMSGKVDTTKKTVCVVSGGNVDVTTLSRVITRGLTYGGRLATITTKLADRAGSLANLLNVVGGTGANVVRIHHEREDVNSEVNACVVSMVLETRNADHVQKIKDELTAKGYSLLDA